MRMNDLQKYMRLAGYSTKTIESYSRCVSEIGQQDILQFLDKLAKKNRSSYTLNQYHSAYKLYKTKVLREKFDIPLPYAKRHKRLPIVLNRDEIVKLIESTTNIKHKTLLSFAYGSGLRVSEVVGLKVEDIDLREMTVLIRNAKGNKDRISIIPEKIIDNLTRLVMGKVKDAYVFESERGGKLSTRSAQMIFSNALRKVGINKKATFHSLRHSFATHLLENGVSIRYIQELLGHNSITTTQIYTNVTNPNIKNIRSPL